MTAKTVHQIYELSERMPALIYHISSVFVVVAFTTKVINHTAKGASPGRFDEIRDFPFLVQLKIDMDTYTMWCAGCYIRPRWVITAAHCLNINENNRNIPPSVGKMQRVECIMGMNEEGMHQSMPSDKLLINPNYSHTKERVTNDIGLVELKSAFRLSRAVNVILIPNTPNDYGGERVTVINWTELGTDAGHIISHEALTHSTGDCKMRTRSNTTICIGDKGKFVCAGDSGGPIIFKGMAIGVCSYGYGCKSDFTVYENIYAHADWIESLAGPQTREKPMNIIAMMNATPKITTYFCFIFISVAINCVDLIRLKY